MTKTAEPQDRFTEILQHRIRYYYRGGGAPETLDEASVEHIEALIRKGFNQGELCYNDPKTDEEYRGWWSIEPSGAAALENDPEDRYIEILQHRVCYHYQGDGAPDAMDEASVEHVEKLIKQGYIEGELCYYDSENDTEYRGWWAIEK